MAELIYSLETILGFYAVAFALVFFVIIWKRLGGWPEAYYRIRQIPYFTLRVIMADGTPSRTVHRMSMIQHKNPPVFEWNGRIWTIDHEQALRDNGRPSWWYLHDETRPLPLFDWQKGTKINPKLLFAAFKDDTIQKVHGIGQPKGKAPWALVMLLIGLVVILAGAGLYYNYNAFCGLNPARC